MRKVAWQEAITNPERTGSAGEQYRSYRMIQKPSGIVTFFSLTRGSTSPYTAESKPDFLSIHCRSRSN